MLRLITLVVAALLLSAPSHAQQPTRVPRIGFVMPGTAEASARLLDAFRQGLRDLGYVEGQNITIEFRWQPPERPEALSGIVNELVRSKPDVLVGPTTPQVLALKKATSTIPIVMVVPSDPVGTGLVQSLARPGGNVTGLAFTAQRLGLNLYSAEVREPSEFASAFAAIKQAQAEAVVVQADQLTWVHRKEIANLAQCTGAATAGFAACCRAKRWARLERRCYILCCGGISIWTGSPT
jgi:hypothetical protein